MKNKIFGGVAMVLTSALMMLGACNKSVQNELGAEGSADTTAVKNKVLFVMIDGAVGDEVRKIQAPTLVNMADNAIFSWDALSDYENNASGNYLTWANMLTGTEAGKHGVTGDSFTGNNFSNYPSIFTRLKNARPDIKTAAFTATKILGDNLTADANVKQSFENNDVAVKDAAKAEVSSATGADLVFLQLHNVETAGAAGGYTAENTVYKNAVLTADAQIQELMTAIAARPTYLKENWLIMVTSNKGNNTPFVPGPGEIWSAFKDGRHNTMFLAYNFTPVPNFRIQSAAKPSVIPYIGTAPLYNGTQADNRRATLESNSTLGNIGATGSFTIQCKVKIPAGNYYYPAILGKRAGFSNGVPGWVFFLEGDYWMINFGHESGSGNAQLAGTKVSDNQWHTLTATIHQVDANTRNVYVFTDGVRSASPINIASRGNLNSPRPFNVGNLITSNGEINVNYFVTDIRLYNTALPDAYIQSNYCRTDVAEDEYKTNLVGFWPSNVVQPDGKTIKDESGGNNDLTIQSYNPGIFNDITTNVCPQIVPAVYRSVPNSVDVAMQVYQWLGVLTPPSWKLDGKTWVPQYINVR